MRVKLLVEDSRPIAAPMRSLPAISPIIVRRTGISIAQKRPLIAAPMPT